MKELTQLELKKYLSYNKETGTFIWIGKPRKSNAKIGSVAGCFDKHSGYRSIGVVNSFYFEHRLAWLYVYGYFPSQIDHINHNRSDNRIINLREANQKENCRNQSIPTNNTSGVIGVSRIKSRNKWQATIYDGRKNINLGMFDLFEDAVSAREAANKKHGYHKNHGGVLCVSS